MESLMKSWNEGVYRAFWGSIRKKGLNPFPFFGTVGFMEGGGKMSGKRENILVSACLLGINCRYDGGNGRNEEVLGLMEEYNLIPVCPEQLGGLETPREPAERKDHNGEDIRVVNQSGRDVTPYFKRGAEETLKLGMLFGCKRAVLKERSPSCGHGVIYDGTFSGNKVSGSGVTAMLLEENGITVTGESGIRDLQGEKERKEVEAMEGK